MKASTRQKIYNALYAIIPLLLAGIFVFVYVFGKKQESVLEDQVVINEVCTNNNAIFIDANNEGCDYVEIYNPTRKPIDISGWYLSDDMSALTKVKIKGKVLEPGEFYIIYLDGSASFGQIYLASGPLQYESQGECVALTLSSKHEEYLAISDAKMNLVDSVTVPVMDEDMCFARTNDGINQWEVLTPSPLLTNQNSSKEKWELPNPIPLPEREDESEDQRRYTVNITMRVEDLYDYEKGIYTQGIAWDRYLASIGENETETGFLETDMVYHSNWKMGWKRQAYIQIYDCDRNLIEEKKAHVSCHGNTSIVDDSKSLNVYCDDEEGFHLFSDTDSQAAILLRNGGSERFQTKFRDPLLQSCAKDLNLSVQDYIFTDVYLNGEYLGPYAIMEKYNADYLNKHYGVEENIAILKNPIVPTRSYIVEGNVSDMADFIALKDFAREHDLTDDDNYKFIADRMDIESFLDYTAVHVYLGNVDVYPNNNIYVWRAMGEGDNPYSDGRWRFMLQDLDSTAGADLSYDSYNPDEGRMRIIVDKSIDNFVTNLVAWDSEGAETNLVSDPLFARLMERDDFKEAFTDRIISLAETNYNVDVMEEKIDASYDQIKTGWVERAKIDKSILKSHRNDFQDFFDGRLEYVLNYIEKHF